MECLFCGFSKVEEMEGLDLNASEAAEEERDDLVSECHICEGVPMRKCCICPMWYCPVCEGDLNMYICLDCIFKTIN